MSSNNDRDRILERLPRSVPLLREPTSSSIVPESSHDHILQTFIVAWRNQGGHIEVQPSPTAARLALLGMLREQHPHQLMAWSMDQLYLPDLDSALEDIGIEVVSPERRQLDPDLVWGLTGADAALAATGSLVLIPGQDRSWVPALIPMHHIIILPISHIHANVHAWQKTLHALGRGDDLGRGLIISGPSISEDIERHPHRGMFGPRHLHIVAFSPAPKNGVT